MEQLIRILHLEDNNLDAELAASSLESGGLECGIVRVQTRDEFARALEKGGFDLIIADYKLPSFDGASALAMSREKCPGVPFIFVSGTMGEDIAVEALKNGATDYVLKDRLSRLASAVERALREAQEHEARRKAEESVRKLNRLYAVLSSVNHLIIRAHDPQTLFDGVCRILVEEGIFLSAWVGLTDEAMRTITPAAHSGCCAEGYLKNVKVSMDDIPEGRGPTGVAVREARHVVNNDTEHNPAMSLWCDEALKCGFRSSAAFPLITNGIATGAITVYSAEKNFFDEEEVRLLDALAADVSHALWSMEQENMRRKAEEETRDLNEKLQRLVEEALVGAYIIQDGRYVYFNRRLTEMLGFTKEELLLEDTLAPVHPDDIERVRKNLRRLLEGKAKDMRYEFRLFMKGGSLAHAEAFHSYTLYRGKPSVIGTLIDITERKLAEEAVIRTKEEWERTFNSVPDMIAILDDQHRIVRVNAAMASRLGLTPDECVGLPCYKSVHGLSMPPEFCPHTRTVRDGKQHIQEVHEDRLGGDFLVSTTPLLDENGKMAGSVHVAHDITDRKRAEREKSDFLAMLTHDFKSPLTTILGYSELLLESKFDRLDAEVKMMVSSIRDGGGKLFHMVEDFLTISKMETGHLKLNPKPADMSNILHEASREVEAALKSKHLTLDKKIQDNLAAVLDHKLAQRAVLNLLQNAINYTPAGGRITLGAVSAVEGDGNYVVISVADTGQGIPADLQNRIFDKYYRAPHTSGVKGTGLGLYIVKAVAEAHGGRVELQSEPGVGSTFKLILPLSPAP